MSTADEEKVDEFLKEGVDYRQRRAQQHYQQLRGRRAKEMQMWNDWHQGGRKPADLEPLLESIDPMIAREAKKRVAGTAGRIPMSAVKNELRNHAVTAIHSYDPEFVSKSGRTTQLSTHIHTNFQRVTDFVSARRNTKYMPRNKNDRYAEFNNAREEFKQEFGRDPSTHEIHGLLPKWKPKMIAEMEQGYAPEVFSGLGTPLEGDVFESEAGRSAFLATKMLMTQQERDFGEMYFPKKGARPEVRAIAKAMGIPEHKAYRLKAAVERKVAPVYRAK